MSELKRQDRILLEENNLIFNSSQSERKVHLNIATTSQKSLYDPKLNITTITAVASSKIWDRITSNSSEVYLHILVMGKRFLSGYGG